MDSLTGRVAVITGAAQGQGAAEARLLAEHGAHVVVADLKEDGEGLARDLDESTPGSAEYIHLDVTDEEGWRVLEDDLRRRHGRLDVLVNNAGVAFRYGMMETSREDFERVLNVNLTGPFLAMRVLAPLMRDSGGGSIINVGSAAGMTGTSRRRTQRASGAFAVSPRSRPWSSPRGRSAQTPSTRASSTRPWSPATRRFRRP